MASLANVTVTIFKAEGLVALNPGGTSNPVVTASIGSQSASTNVVSKTTNPTFTDATFHFQSCPMPTVLTLKVINRLPFVDVEDLLGTATVTLFDATSGKVEKSVPLSHGGNAALASKAGEKGCGSVAIAYEVVETAASPVNATAPTTFPTTATASASTPRAEPVPIPIPAAAHISGPHAAQPPAKPSSASSTSSSSSASMSGAAREAAHQTSTGSLTASNPSATNPTHRSPKIAAASAAPALLPSHLTPPSLTPARQPVSLGYYVADSAAAAPHAQATIAANNSGQPGFVSYPVQGLRPQEEAPALAVPTPVVLNSNSEPGSFFANNDLSSRLSGAPVARPLGQVQPPSNAPVPLLPVASNTPQASRYTPSSVYDAATAARSAASSFSAKQPPTPNSLLYTSAATAPVAQPQPLLVVPPHIEGTPMLEGNASRPPSAMQPLPQAGAAQPCFPAARIDAATALAERHMGSSSTTSRPASTSAAVVAVAPRPAPWGRVNSGGGTPASHPAHPSAASAGHTLPLGRVARPRSGEDLCAADGAARCSSKNRREHAMYGGAAVPKAMEMEGDASDARRLYADPQYLFDCAATGNDIGIFARLKKADPFFANGFLECRDYAGRTLLHVAAWNGQVAVMQTLLSTQPADTAQSDSVAEKDRLLRGNLVRSLFSSPGGNSILHAAAMGGQKDVVTYLLQSSHTEFPALKTTKNVRGLTPAEAAKECGFTELAMMLL